MTWQRIAALIILAIGAGGHLLALGMIVRMRLWLGGRGAGWPRILLRTLIWCEVAFAVLYLISLWRTLGLPGAVVRDVLNLAAALFVTVIPWLLALALHRWRASAEREREQGAEAGP